MLDWNAAFDATLKIFKINSTELAEKSGLSRPLISRFRHGKQPTTTDSLNALLKSMPVEAFIYFFHKLLRTSDVRTIHFVNQLTEGLNTLEIYEIMLLLSKKVDVEKISTIKGELLVVESLKGELLGHFGSREAMGEYLAARAEDPPKPDPIKDVVKESVSPIIEFESLSEEELKQYELQ